MKHPAFRRSHQIFAAIIFAVPLVACSEPIQSPMSPDGTLSLSSGSERSDLTVPVAHIIRPSETSEAGEIDWLPVNNPATALHYVWLPERPVGNPRLFLFMPGTGNRPVDYRLISAEAARAGYHVIGLMYQNDKALEMICKASIDIDCAQKVRMEMLTGDPLSALVSVTRGNSIDHRLERLLIHMATEWPEEGWGEFLEEGAPNWSKIAVAGQSMGAGQAALIARERTVPRVAMFSGPPDQANAPAIDSWVKIGATPVSRMFAIYHDSDRLRAGISSNMSERGLGLTALGTIGVGTLGPWCTPADTLPLSDHGFRAAHVLVTNLVPNSPDGCEGGTNGNAHRSTARDDFTPLTNGEPALLGAWRYMIGHPGSIDARPEDEGETG